MGNLNRWFKFHPQDWRVDPALRQVSLAARGLWIELICIMHDCEPYGHLVDKHGQPMSIAAIRRMVQPRSGEDIAELMAELEEAGAVYFTKTEPRILYSKRMVRDGDYQAKQTDHGKAGGNPNLFKRKRKTRPLTLPLKGTLKATPDDVNQSGQNANCGKAPKYVPKMADNLLSNNGKARPLRPPLKGTLKPESERKTSESLLSDSESSRAGALLGGAAPRAISKPVKKINGHHSKPIEIDDEVPL